MYGARGKLAVIWIYVNYLNYLSICFQNHFPSLSTLWYYLWHSESGICGKQGASGEKLMCSHSFLVSWWNWCKPFSSPLINCSLANEGSFLKGSYFLNQWSRQEITINILTISHLFPLWILKVLTTTNIPEKIKTKNTVKRTNSTQNETSTQNDFPMVLAHPTRAKCHMSSASAPAWLLTWHTITFSQTQHNTHHLPKSFAHGFGPMCRTEFSS